MRNLLLVAGPVTDPNRFMADLGCHPDIAALPPVSLSNALHAVARRAVAAATDDGRNGDALVAHARQEGGAALAAYFDRLRHSTGRSVIVLHDPSGPMFPFLNPPGVDLLVLLRDAESAARVIGGAGMSQVVDAARRALHAFERRIASFGIGEDRIFTVDEERLQREPGAVWPEICRLIGVDVAADAVASMGRSVPMPWSLRGAPI